MSTSVETVPGDKTSAKRMVIMLILAFLGSILNLFGGLTIFVVYMGFFYSTNYVTGVALAGLAFLLLFLSFLTLSLYPKRGLRQVAAGLLAIIPWGLGLIASYSVPLFKLEKIDNLPFILLATGIGFAIAISLLISGRIKGGADMGGVALGLLIGTVLRMTNLFHQSSYDFSPLWLTAVLFSEIFSRRATIRAVIFGIFFCAGLIMLSAFITNVLKL